MSERSREETARPGSHGTWVRARRMLREAGWRRTAGHALRRLLAPVVETGGLVFFERDLDGPLPPVEGWEDVREATAARLVDVARSSDPARSREVLRERFRRGHRCFLVEQAGGPGHTRWVRDDDPFLPELGRRLRLAPGDLYLYDGYTHAAARRCGLDGKTRGAIFRDARARGFARVVSYVRSDNPGGLRAAARWQDRVGEVRFLRIGSRVFLLSDPDAIRPLGLSGPTSEASEEEVSVRSRQWEAWFRGWIEQPAEKRSTGFSHLPSAYFDAMTELVAARLDLEGGGARLLDVGCASAGITRRLAPLCRDTVGVDATLGLLADAEQAGQAGLRFVASDARILPFPAGSFDRVNCTGMLHTLPSEADGRRVLAELVRVCRPGGRILVGALPDRRRQGRARRELWRRGGWRGKVEVLAGLLVPRSLRRAGRRWLRRGERGAELVSLEYDLPALARRLETDGLRSRLESFPDGFWSRDFRETRTNLVIDVPAADRAPAGEPGPVSAQPSPAPPMAARGAEAVLAPTEAGFR